MKTVVGVDIGTTSVRAIEVSGGSTARPRITRMAELPLPDDAVIRGEVKEPHTVAMVLRKLWGTGGFSSRSVALGIGSPRVLARDLSLPRMPLAQIRETLPFQVQDMLPMPVVDAVLDFYPVAEAPSEQGPVVHGILVAAAKDTVMASADAARLAGLRPVAVDLNPFALSRVVSRSNDVTGTVALVDIGSSTTSVLVTTNGVPEFVRLIGTGGFDITRAVATRIETDLQIAERAKRAVGLTDRALPDDHRPVLEAVYSATSELVTNIRNTIRFFDSTHPDRPVTRILLVGNGSRLEGLSRAMAEFTAVPVALVDPLGGIDRRAPKARGSSEPDPAGFTLALGLALGAAA